MYLARRYFQMSWEEWGNEPWYVTAAYLEGLRKHGVLGDDTAQATQQKTPSAVGTGTRKPPPVDLTGPGLIPPGFTTRLAG